MSRVKRARTPPCYNDLTTAGAETFRREEKKTIACHTVAPMENLKNSYDREELLACARGELFGPGNAQLPLPNMLMFDRITEINDHGGSTGKGIMVAELDIHPDIWFFECHFQGDPVMPGCLGLDAMWQMVGFYLGWTGAPGRGRALGSGQVKFSGQVTPRNRLVRYTIDIKRIIRRGLIMGVADGTMEVDDRTIYTASDLRVGLFQQTENF